MNKLTLSIFTKHWNNKPLETLAELTASLGFDGIEFPLREGYQLNPSKPETELPRLVNMLKPYNLKVCSIAADTTEAVFAGCAAAGIPLIRIMLMLNHNVKDNYFQDEAKMRHYIESFLPLCEKYNIKVGIQQHFMSRIKTAMEMRSLLAPYNPKLVGGIWDAAHSGLAGEAPEQALDIMWDNLAIVNFKNAHYIPQENNLSSENFGRYFTTGQKGLCPWGRTIAHLQHRGYTGNICLPAEYTDEENTEAYAAEDIKYIKELIIRAKQPY